jgi:hypothetical protein
MPATLKARRDNTIIHYVRRKVKPNQLSSQDQKDKETQQEDQNEHLDNTDNKFKNEVVKVGKPILLLLMIFG